MSRRMLIPIGAAIILSVNAATGVAQPAPQPSATAAADYSKESAVIERERITIAYDADGSSTREVTLRVRVQSTAALQRMGTVIVPYSRELDTLEILYVRVRKANGATIETPVSSALDVPADVTQTAPMYSDLYLRHVNVQGLEVGDIVEYALRAHERSLIARQFWLEQSWDHDVILLDGELRVSVPADRAVTMKSVDPQPSVGTSDGRRTYVWRYANLQRLSDAEAEVRAYAERDRRADVQLTSFESWTAVGEAVRQLWRDRAEVTPAIRDKALELTAGAASDREKLIALYGYVATKIRYVAIALGVGRIQPHAAAEVLANGFGDCKDKHTLLTALLRAAGIDADAILIAPGAAMDPDVPSLAQFNHVITFVPGVDGGTWLDATLDVAPPGLILAGERDRRVLRIPASAAAAAVTTTPATPIKAPRWTVALTGTLDGDGTLTASVTETYEGDAEVVLRQLFRSIEQARWPELVSHMSIADRNGGTASDVHVTAPDDTSTPFTLTYRYVHDKFSGWANGRIAAPMPIIGLPGLPADSDPNVPLQLSSGFQTHVTSRIALPAGYDIALKDGAAPETTTRNAFLDYHLRNTIADRTFTAERDVTITAKTVELDQIAAYRAFLKSIGDDPSTVTLRRIKPWSWGDRAAIDWYAGSSPTAVSTMQAAVSASERGDHQTALSSLDELTRAEPDDAAAGVLLGWAQRQAGNRERGLQTLRAQLARAPTPSGFKLLAAWLAADGHREDAIVAWQDGYKRFPDDRELPLYLAEALVDVKQYQQALPLLQSRSAASPPSVRLLWNLGRALVGAGKPADAVDAFTKAADADPSALSLNNIAWEMAVDGIGLEAARGLAERAVRATEAEAGRLTLSALDANGVQTMSALAAHWDTLGWVHFRLGDLDTAARYLESAWDLGQTSVLAEHVAELYEAKGDRDIAASFYARALALPNPDVTAAPKLLALVPDTVRRTSLVSSAMASVVDARTATVPRIPDVAGGADVFVRVGPGGAVDDVRFAGGAPEMRPEAEMVRAAKVPSRLPRSDAPPVIRQGTLMCGGPSPTTCRLVLVPVSLVRPPS